MLEPEGTGLPFAVDLTEGRWQVEWFDVARRQPHENPPVEVVRAGSVEFTAPFGDTPAVLHLLQIAND